MPEEVSAAIDLIGNRARIEILHQLSLRGAMTTTELADAVAATRASTHAHLTALEAAGLIVGDVPAETRRRRTVRWSVERAALAAAFQIVRQYALADDQPGQAVWSPHTRG